MSGIIQMKCCHPLFYIHMKSYNYCSASACADWQDSTGHERRAWRDGRNEESPRLCLATAYRLTCRHHQNLVSRRLYLVKFFRNLLLGENNELKNRYMLIGYKDDENDTHTSTRTSTHASSIDIQPFSGNVTRLVLSIGKEEMSVKSMMEAVGLKNRPNFMDYSLTPAIREGFVCMKYPANPHHPRQRYLLTVKGLMLLDGNNS